MDIKNYTQIGLPKKAGKRPYVKIMGRIFIVLVTLGFSAFFVNRYIFKSKAGADVATVTLLPKGTSVTQREAFTQSVRINAGAKKISAVDITINYDPEYFAYIERDELTLLESVIPQISTNSAYFGNLIMQKVSAKKDSVRIVMVSKGRDSQLASNVVIPLRFRGLKPTEEPQSLVFNEPASQIVGTTGASDHQFNIDSSDAESVVSISPSISCLNDGQCGENAGCASNGFCVCNSQKYNCDQNWDNGCESETACVATGSVSLNLKVKLQGVTSKPKTAQLLKFKFVLKNSENNKQQKGVNLRVNENGLFSGKANFDKIAPGNNFQLLIKGPKHVQKRFCTLTPEKADYHCSINEGFVLSTGENEADLSAVPLFTGDLPEQDGILNSKDVSTLKDCIKERSEACIEKTDVNYDGVTNGVDLSLLFKAMATKYDDEN